MFFSFLFFLFFYQRILFPFETAGNWPCEICFFLFFFFFFSIKESCFLLKQREIGHAKYVFFFSFFLFFYQRILFPFETAGNWPCEICFLFFYFFLVFYQRILFPTEKNTQV